MLKNKNKIIILSSVIVLLVAFIINLYGNDSKYVLESNKLNRNVSNMLTMMYETDVDGVYSPAPTTDTEWKTDMYFNPILSGCEHGGAVSFIDGKVQLESSYTDKCYIYFSNSDNSGGNDSESDKSNEFVMVNAVEYIKSLESSNNHLYYHDNNLKNSAKDGSYRYSGTSSIVNDNYVCFGYDKDLFTSKVCNTSNYNSEYLYRIIGIFNVQTPDGEKQLLKLMKNTSYVSSNWGGTVCSNSYASSTLFADTLNSHTTSGSALESGYLYTLEQYGWVDYIATPTWYVGGCSYDNCITNGAYSAVVNEMTGTTSNNKIGTLYVNEYAYATSADYWSTSLNNGNIKYNNWLSANGIWFVTPNADRNAFHTDGGGTIEVMYVCNSSATVRPTFYLESSVKFVGEHLGTSSDPYILSL